MQQIVIDVNDATAKKWQVTSPEIKSQLDKNIEKQLARTSFTVNQQILLVFNFHINRLAHPLTAC